MAGSWEALRFLTPGWTDLVEVLVVAFLLYRVLLVLQRTRAMQIIIGVVLLALGYAAARLFELILIRTILEAFFQYGAIAALVVFQPELRSGLARLGQSRIIRAIQRIDASRVSSEIVEAVQRLSRARHGAIIAIERDIDLDVYAETGSPVQARVSSEMLTTIFTPLSPLHDGAVLIRGDVIETAGAILPLTQTPVRDRSLGTRHRAALGLSEETDAIVIVVSEETSQISVAASGRLEQGIDAERLQQILAGPPPEPEPEPARASVTTRVGNATSAEA